MTERKEAVKIEGRQYVVVERDAFFNVGEVITLIDDDGSRNPWFDGKNVKHEPQAMDRVMLLAETEETATLKPELVTEFEVGTVYAGSDNDAICKIAGGTYLYADFDCKSDFTYDSCLDESDDTWTVATAEQAAEFNKRKLQHQLDNLEVGEVYAITAYDDWIARVIRVENGKVTVSSRMTPEDGYYAGNEGYVTPAEIRPATAEEIAELEAVEIKAGDRVAPAPTEPELPKHKFAVGETLTVLNQSEYWHKIAVGSEVTVERLGGLWESHKDGIPLYRVVDTGCCKQTVLETQLEPVKEPEQFLPEVGKIYFAVYADGSGYRMIQKNIETLVLLIDGAHYFKNGVTDTSDTGGGWTEATPEQAVKLLQAKVDHSDATEADLKQLSELMPLDNPELEVGEVYFCKTGASNLWAYRYKQGSYTTSHSACVILSTNFFDTDNHVYSRDIDHRKALPHEVAKLEAAEKEHGCEYVKPLINSKGTVIEVGQYYSTKEWGTIAKITGLKGDGFLEVRLEGTLGEEFFMDEINNPYCNALLPATPAEIEQFKQAEAKANFKLEIGKQYKAEVKGETVTFTVIKVDNGLVVVNQTMLNGHINCYFLVLDDPIWQTAVEVTQHG